jgi:hypothetical protein
MSHSVILGSFQVRDLDFVESPFIALLFFGLKALVHDTWFFFYLEHWCYVFPSELLTLGCHIFLSHDC